MADVEDRVRNALEEPIREAIQSGLTVRSFVEIAAQMWDAQLFEMRLSDSKEWTALLERKRS